MLCVLASLRPCVKIFVMKIVVRGTNWIGDAVMTIPALKRLRHIFPDAHISLHTHTWAEGIFQNATFIDEIIPFEKESNAFKTVRSQAKIWREGNFDLAVLFTNSFQTALLANRGKVKTSFGYKNEGRGFLLTDPINKPSWKGEKHEIYYYLNLVSKIEDHYFDRQTVLDENQIRLNLTVSNERKLKAKNILKKNGIDLSKKVIAFGVGSTNSRAKRWLPISYAELNDKLQKNIEANVFLLGSENELDISQEVFEKSKIKPIILTGKTNLSEAVSILSEIDLFISNDMGLAHIAPAVGTKTLVIFGPTNPKTTKPWGSEIIRKEIECSPCMLRDCPIDHPCMTQISADEVFEKTINLLGTK